MKVTATGFVTSFAVTFVLVAARGCALVGCAIAAVKCMTMGLWWGAWLFGSIAYVIHTQVSIAPDVELPIKEHAVCPNCGNAVNERDTCIYCSPETQ
jgi:hypothetical protein